MISNRSPWTDQLIRQRSHQPLTTNYQTDIAVVGAGIAGVTTAYFLLQESNYHVTLVEAGLAAHGATGHNAGQLVSYFERQLSELTRDYGLAAAAEAQRSIDSAWQLLTTIYTQTGIQTPLAKFTGYAGCQDIDEILIHLENSRCATQAGLTPEPVMIADMPDLVRQIPNQYFGLYTMTPPARIREILETNDTRYIAAVSAQKGVMNSALFCEDLIAFMLSAFPDRFQLFEHSPVSDVVLEKHQATLHINDLEITAGRVILCTNGFERFSITNQAGPDINTRFHHLVRGSVGYMAAYVETSNHPPTAISYLPDRTAKGDAFFENVPYFYLTRRSLSNGDETTQNLICIGGPESLMDDTNQYQHEHPYPEEAQTAIDAFLHKTYTYAPTTQIEYKYRWHGLMGYTPNGVRCVGPEPLNPVLLYNLGCNGVGILPSIYGSKRISLQLTGKKLPPSIFDPQLSYE